MEDHPQDTIQAIKARLIAHRTFPELILEINKNELNHKLTKDHRQV